MNRIKIVATIGPACADPGTLGRLVEAGMDVARLNGSHADLDWHARVIGLIRGVAPETPILFDVPGRKIRTGRLEEEPIFGVGDEVVLTTGAGDGRDRRVAVTSERLHTLLVPGDTVLADDGSLRFEVVRVDGPDIVCRALIAGRLRSSKGINVPTLDLSADRLPDRDAAVLDFARRMAIDYVGVSFVDGARLVGLVRDRLGRSGPRVVAKIENGTGLANMTDVIAAADAVMIDRGDLSVETGLEGIALKQKRIVAAATELGKPVIIATEMLNSMIESPVPTKAEVTDISNAILDGASALMLSGETAVGRYPVEAVETMRRIADTVAATVVPAAADATDEGASAPGAMGEAVALLARLLPVTKIVAVTRSGYAARVVANYRPRQEILVVTDDPATARSANLLFGCRGIAVSVPFLRTSTDHIAACLEELWRRGVVAADDTVLVTSVGYPHSGRRMNLLETHVISELRDTLGWGEPGEDGSRPADSAAPAPAPGRRRVARAPGRRSATRLEQVR